ncbi:MAG: HK97 family phage prohead protease [Acetobacter sp.]|nr:HK97 family phage prohead protease [Acetobacter sp.]
MFNVESVVLYQEGKYEEREVIEPCAISKEFLDGCDIKMTMYHNRQIVLARSNKGKGTLTYGIDQKGVYFEFDAPRT